MLRGTRTTTQLTPYIRQPLGEWRDIGNKESKRTPTRLRSRDRHFSSSCEVGMETQGRRGQGRRNVIFFSSCNSSTSGHRIQETVDNGPPTFFDRKEKIHQKDTEQDQQQGIQQPPVAAVMAASLASETLESTAFLMSSCSLLSSSSKFWRRPATCLAVESCFAAIRFKKLPSTRRRAGDTPRNPFITRSSERNNGGQGTEPDNNSRAPPSYHTTEGRGFGRTAHTKYLSAFGSGGYHDACYFPPLFSLEQELQWRCHTHDRGT